MFAKSSSFLSYNNEAKEIDQSPKRLANYRKKNLSHSKAAETTTLTVNHSDIQFIISSYN